jgi:molybdopterin-guanine dinucleotide biosynthesis protein A
MTIKSGVTAVVLAGGRSTRFGRDKLAEPMAGRPLLHHAVEAVRPFAAEILVITAPDGDMVLPADVHTVHDQVAHEGPLVGLLTGLRSAREPIVLVVGGDMPTLQSAVLAMLLDTAEDSAHDAVVLEYDGRPRPLPLVVRREPALALAQVLVSNGERRLRALVEVLNASVIESLSWRAVDPDARTVRDVDTPADLA